MSELLSRTIHPATQQHIDAYRIVRKWFGCLICGHTFAVGDRHRWIYANARDAVFKYGNFYVCESCDEGDEATLMKAASAAESLMEHGPMAERLWRGRWEQGAIREEVTP